MKLIAYTAPQKDRSTAEALQAMDIEAECPIVLEPGKSRGKSRQPEMHERVIIPRVVFITCTEAQYYHAMATRAARHIIACLRVSDREWQGDVTRFIADAAEELAYTRARIAAGEIVQHFRPGEELAIIGGPLAGRVMTFVQTVERAGGATPKVRGKVLLFGREVETDADPLAVKRRA